jgi:hypothetical protein
MSRASNRIRIGAPLRREPHVAGDSTSDDRARAGSPLVVLKIQLAWAVVSWFLVEIQAATVNPQVAILWLALPMLAVVGLLALALSPVTFVVTYGVRRIAVSSQRAALAVVVVFAGAWAFAAGVVLGNLEVLGAPAKLGGVTIAALASVAYGLAFIRATGRIRGGRRMTSPDAD